MNFNVLKKKLKKFSYNELLQTFVYINITYDFIISIYINKNELKKYKQLKIILKLQQ